jgi:alanine-glyoxylate transaminase / serine-glyoxylate transaminase / serine-pyruvate transaminase
MLAPVTETLLMGPGPSNVAQSVRDALALPTIGHLDPRFIAIMDEVKAMLRTVFQTANQITIPISGTGSAGMEASFVNFVEPGDKVLILINGVFGKRMEDLAVRLGADVTTIEYEWGTPVTVERVKEALAGADYRVVAVVHAETSTGVRNPVDQIADVVRGSGSLFLVDTVTSLGGIPVTADAWGADIVYSGTQKCLSCPPGLAPMTVSPRAHERLTARSSKVPNWYLDLSLLTSYWAGAKRSYHHTAPINMIYALYQALVDLVGEGLDAAHARHRRAHEELAAGLEKIGLSLFVEPEYRLPMLNAVTVPEGVDEAQVRARLLEEFDIEIGAGLGPLAGRIWRIGLMGETARTASVERLTAALAKVL